MTSSASGRFAYKYSAVFSAFGMIFSDLQILMTKSTLLFSHIRYLASPSTKCLVRLGSFQQQSLLHMSLPFMNKDESSDKRSSSKQKDWSQEGPHMRVEAKAAAENIGKNTG
jgi:hypothetical protein